MCVNTRHTRSHTKMHIYKNYKSTSLELTTQQKWIQARHQTIPMFKDKMALINSVPIKGKRITILAEIYPQVLDQLYSKHMGIEKKKTRLLARESIYWINMNADIENTVINCSTCLGCQQMPPKEKCIPYKIQGKPWKMTGEDLFASNNGNFLFVLYITTANSNS